MDASASEPGASGGEAERQTLMDLLEHTQGLLKASQDAAVRERQDQSEQYRLLELRLSKQLKLLKDENTSLREELERLNKTQGLDGMSLKGYMLREIEKVETKAAEREAELLGLVESARNEVHIYKGHLESRAKVIADDHAQVSRDLEAAKQETKRIHAYYSTQIQDLKTEHTATLANLRRAAEDLKVARLETQNVQEAENAKKAQMQQAWEKEKESLVGQVKKLQKTLNDREKVVTELSSAVESDKRAEMTPLRAQNETLNFDKFALKQQLQLASTLYIKKEKNMMLQLEKWKKLSEQLKEKTTPTAPQDTDNGRLLALLMNLEQNDKQIRETIHNLEFYTQKLNTVLEVETEKEVKEPDVDVMERIREKEANVDRLLSQLQKSRASNEIDHLEREFTELAQAYKTSLREVCERATQAVKATSEELQEQIRGLKTETDDLVVLRSENQSLLQELDQARQKFKQEVEAQVSLELAPIQQELDHAKQMIMTYLEANQALQEAIDRHKAQGEVAGDAGLEIARLKAEVARLTAENATLLETKTKAQEASNAANTKLREQLEKKEKESTNLKGKLVQEKNRANDRIQATTAKLEEALSMMSEANAAIKAEIDNLVTALPETVKLAKAWEETEAEAVGVLKGQLAEREALIAEIREQWKAEVASAPKASSDSEVDISSWRSQLSHAEAQTHALSSMSSSLSQMLQTLSQLAEALTSSLEKHEPRDSNAMHFETELESLRQELEDKEAEHQHEMELVRSQAEAEVKSVKTIEFALTAEITALRAKIKELKSLKAN